MKLQLLCIRCIISQTLEVLEVLRKTPQEKEKILREVLKLLSSASYDQTSPELAEIVYKRITELAGVEDPYREEKKKQNELAERIVKNFEEKLSGLSLPDVLKLSVLGNSIDYGTETRFDVEKELSSFLKYQLPEETLREFARDLLDAEKMTIIGDNAGEIVFDRLLIKYIKDKRPDLEIFYTVRGGPIINDATEEEARQVGMHKYATVVSTGQKIAGLVPERASKEVLQLLKDSDVILSKGQGNYETLEHRNLGIYFLFRVKCPVVGENLGKKVGDIVFIRR